MKKMLITFVALLLATVQAFACAALTKNGKPCKNPPVSGSQYCWRHGGRAHGQGNENAKQNADGDTDKKVVEEPKPIEMDSFLGIKFGEPAKKVGGSTVKGSKNKRNVPLSRAFRNFKNATVSFDPKSGLSQKIETECILPTRYSKEDAIKEHSAVKAILEKKYSVQLGGPEMLYYNSYRSPSRLASMGLGGSTFSSTANASYDDSNFSIDLSCWRCKVPNKAMKGPGVPDTLDAYKLILTVSSKKSVDEKPVEENVDLKGIDAL